MLFDWVRETKSHICSRSLWILNNLRQQFCKTVLNLVPQHLAKAFITPDMTPKERKSNKTLRTKLSKLNKSRVGRINYIIK